MKTKFEVDDVVLITGSSNRQCHKINSVVTITNKRLTKKGMMYKGGHEVEGWISEKDLEIYNPLELKITPPKGCEVDKNKSTFELIIFKKK